MFCELGGEFVDTGHEDLQKLGAELGVEMQKLAAEGDGEDLYFFKGVFHTPKDMLDPESRRAPLRRSPSRSPRTPTS